MTVGSKRGAWDNCNSRLFNQVFRKSKVVLNSVQPLDDLAHVGEDIEGPIGAQAIHARDLIHGCHYIIVAILKSLTHILNERLIAIQCSFCGNLGDRGGI